MSLETLLTELVEQLDNEQTVAIGLTGSHTRGVAQPYSDVDIFQFVREMPPDPYAEYMLRQHGDYLVSLSVRTIASQREKMQDPGGALSVVPGLRQTRILLDKNGELAQLIAEANAFQWVSVQAAADAQASYELLGNAEEAHKIMNGLQQADHDLILLWLGVMINALTRAVTLHKGLLEDSENGFYDAARRAVGLDSEWAHQQRLALGLEVASPHMRGEAGLRLYRETARLLQSIILPDHAGVINHTLRRITDWVG